MYALPNNSQHKLIVKVRGGISQKLDNFSSASASLAATTRVNNQNKSSASKDSTFSSLVPPNLIKDFSSHRQVDELGFNSDLSHLPQPVFHSISHNNGKQKTSSQNHHKAQKQYITPEHNEMIKYAQQSWKGVERDYKKSVNTYTNNLDLNSNSSSSSAATASSEPARKHKQQQAVGNSKSVNRSTPLLLSGSYHHTTGSKDSFQPFDLETFWGNRILKRLTADLWTIVV